MLNNIITDKLTSLKQLCGKYKLRTMYAFGSVCSNNFNNQSDIDFLITFDELPIEEYTENYFDLHYKLQALFQRHIDLLTENSISNPYLKESIEKTKVLIYAA